MSEYLKSHTASADDESVRIFHGESEMYSTKTSSSELGDDIIKIDTSPVKFIRVIPQAEFNNFKFVKNSKHLNGKGITLEKFCGKAENAE